MNFELNDREKILTHIIDMLSSTQLLMPDRPRYEAGAFGEYAHFAYWREPQVGELVLAKTGQPGRWKIGWYEQKLPCGAVIREIGSGELCNYTNESFVAIANLQKSELIEGPERIIRAKVQQAFARGKEYLYRFGGVDFHERHCTIWIREVFGGLNGESEPFAVEIKRDHKQSVKRILETMRAGGYGTRKFKKRKAAA